MSTTLVDLSSSSWPERGPRRMTVVTSQRAGTVRVRVALRLQRGGRLARPLQGERA